jgi:hypothetical protein
MSNPDIAFFLLALNEIVCTETPFLKMLIVPVEFVDAESDTAINWLFSATIKGLLFEGLFEKNSNHLPVLPVPSNPHMVGPLEEFAANCLASSIAACVSVDANPFVLLSNQTP